MTDVELIDELRYTRREVRRLQVSLRVLWLVAVLVVALSAWAFLQQRQINRQQCEGRNQTRAVVAEVIDRLLEPSDPVQVESIRGRLGDALAPVQC